MHEQAEAENDYPALKRSVNKDVSRAHPEGSSYKRVHNLASTTSISFNGDCSSSTSILFKRCSPHLTPVSNITTSESSRDSAAERRLGDRNEAENAVEGKTGEQFTVLRLR